MTAWKGLCAACSTVSDHFPSTLVGRRRQRIQVVQQCCGFKDLRSLYVNRKQAAGVLRVRHRIFDISKESRKKSAKLGIRCGTSLRRIGGQKAIVYEHLNLAAIELNPSVQVWLDLQTQAGSQSSLCCLDQSILVSSLQHRFAVVPDTQPVAGVIKAIVALVSDQNHSRARTDVTVIRNIQQEFVAGLILDSAMKDRNQSFEFNFLRIFHEELYVDVLKFHVLRITPLAG